MLGGVIAALIAVLFATDAHAGFLGGGVTSPVEGSFDNFDRPNSTTIGNGWIEVGANWTITSKAAERALNPNSNTLIANESFSYPSPGTGIYGRFKFIAVFASDVTICFSRNNFAGGCGWSANIDFSNDLVHLANVDFVTNVQSIIASQSITTSQWVDNDLTVDISLILVPGSTSILSFTASFPFSDMAPESFSGVVTNGPLDHDWHAYGFLAGVGTRYRAMYYGHVHTGGGSFLGSGNIQ